MPTPLFTIGAAYNLSKPIREAIGLRCDVTVWDDQLKLFETAIEAYRSVDIVVSSRSPSRSRRSRLIRFVGCQRWCERDWVVLETKAREWQAGEAVHSHY